MTFKINSIVNLTIKDGFEIKGKIVDNIDNIVVINIYEHYDWIIPYENITNVYTEGTYENYYKNNSNN